MLIIRCMQEKSLLRARNLLKNAVRMCTGVKPKINNIREELEEKEIRPSLFPGYKMIYWLPAIRIASYINTTKRASTVVLPFGVISAVLFGAFNVISTNVAIGVILNFTMMTLWLHSFGPMLTNNLIGYIHYNNTEEKVIISFTDYWGHRVDIYTDVEEVTPVSDNQIKFTNGIYRGLYIIKPEIKLKLHLGEASRMNKNELEQIIGEWE